MLWIASGCVKSSALDCEVPMRWNALFDDLEGQAAAIAQAELEGRVDARIRHEVGQLNLIDRLRPTVGASLSLRTSGGAWVIGTVTRVGSEWLLLAEDAGREAVVALGALTAVSGVGRLSAGPDSMTVVESRLGLRHVLRGLARDRSTLRIHLSDSQILDGTIDRVGADFIEVAEHAAGEVRRRDEVRRVSIVAISAIAVIRRDS